MHTHILPEHLPDLCKRYGYGEFVSLQHTAGSHSCCADMYKGSKFFRTVEENCFRPEARIRDMDEQHINVQVLSTVPVMFSYQAKPEDTLDLARYLNDHIAGVCRQHPTRFLGLGTIPMQSVEHAIPELRRCMLELGLVGIQIGSHVNDMMLGDAKLAPIFEEAERLGACIFVHPWDMTGEALMSKYWLPWLVGMPMETSQWPTSTHRHNTAAFHVSLLVCACACACAVLALTLTLLLRLCVCSYGHLFADAVRLDGAPSEPAHHVRSRWW